MLDAIEKDVLRKARCGCWLGVPYMLLFSLPSSLSHRPLSFMTPLATAEPPASTCS